MIEVKNLKKVYGKNTAVDGISFTCAPGTITGFLGPNGAGKSTTMRMMVGLARPTAGSAEIAGRQYSKLVNPARTVGVMLDASAQHAGRTGRETVRLAAAMQRQPKRHADEMLESVGLAAAAKRRVGSYSLGMRQRLGIATAMLGEPEVLILDEPVNGLDPDGIRWMRTMLQDFAASGGTVLLSSHILNEVQATVDRLVVIGGGRIVAEGDLAELVAGRGTVVAAADQQRLADVLKTEDIAAKPFAATGASSGFTVDAEPSAIGSLALKHDLALTELRRADNTGLEDLFFQLTDENSSDKGASK